MNSFALYLLSLATMIGLYALYARFLVPVIEGPPNITLQRELNPPNVQLPGQQYDRERLALLFPADAWEHGECKVLLTEQGLILFKDFHRVQGGYLEVLPFTLITNTATSAGSADIANQQPPTVLRCSKGARIKFDNPDVDPLSGKSSLESARLVGVVDIYRPASGSGKDDGIEMLTSNVQMTKRQIFTIDEVQFAFGPHLGSGRQLSLEFTHKQESLKPAGFDDITGVNRIELAYLKKLKLVPNTKLPANPQNDLSRESGKDNGDVETVDITCTGPFVVDLKKNTATFNDQVLVVLEGRNRNEISCKRLTAHFEPQTPSSISPTASEQVQQTPAAGSWDLQKLVAEGNPATYISQSHMAKVTGSILSYHIVKREIVAQKSSRFDAPVTVVTPDFHFEALQVAYKLKTEAGLGEMIAQGPGSLLQPGDERKRELLVRWNRLLSIEPDQAQHKISVVDGCQIRFDKSTEISSQRMQVWLNELKSEVTTESGTKGSAFQYQPDRMLATGNVKLLSPQLNGETQRLVATWIHGDLNDKQTFQDHQRVGESSWPPLKIFDNGSGQYKSLRVIYPQELTQEQSATGMQPIPPWSSVTQIVAEVDEQPPPFIHQIGHLEPKPRKRYAFKGDEVDIKLLQTGTETSVQDLMATGEVYLAEVAEPFAKSAMPPLVINGHQLRYVPQPEEMARLLVTGSSVRDATVKTEQFQLRGNQIHLDQAANKLWVDGGGEIEIDPRGLAQANRQGSPVEVTDQSHSEGNRTGILATPMQYDRVTVGWQSGMIFNGRKVYFEDGVALTASGKNADGNSVLTSAAGQGVTLELSQQVNFRNMNAGSDEKIQIREVVIVDQVAGSQRVFNYVNAHPNQHRDINSDAVISHKLMNPAGVALEQQQFRAKQITLDIGTGLVTSKGPGFLAQHRKGGQSLLKRPNSMPASTGSSNRNSPQSDMGIVLVRVNFDGTANANIHEKRLLIRGNVRTLYSGVHSFEQILDPDATQTLPANAVKLKSDRLEFDQWTPRDSEEPVQELLAAGNAHVTSDSFEATADQLRYNQATDTLVVEGTARSDAQLWYHPIATPRDRQHLVAQKIIYRPGDQSTEVQGIKNLDIRK